MSALFKNISINLSFPQELRGTPQEQQVVSAVQTTIDPKLVMGNVDSVIKTLFCAQMLGGSGPLLSQLFLPQPVHKQATTTVQPDPTPAMICHYVRSLGEGTDRFTVGTRYVRDRGCILFSFGSAKDIAEAQFKLATLYREGKVVKKNDVEAMRLYEQAAKQGELRAFYQLGKGYQYGKGVPKNLRTAAKIYWLAGELGVEPAYRRLARLYSKGRGVPKDLVQASELCQLPVNHVDPVIGYCLAGLYMGGRGVAQDKGRAVELYRNAADHGYAPAQEALALLYEEGKDVPYNLSEAVRLYQMAVKKECPKALFRLACMHEMGNAEIPQNHEEAKSLYRRAITQGYRPAAVSLALALMVERGRISDEADIVKLMQKGSRNVVREFLVDFFQTLGPGAYPTDVELPKFLRVLADRCYSSAFVRDSRAFEERAILATIRRECRRAANKGSAVAQFVLGYIYESGDGTPYNPIQAVAQYRSSAEQKYVPALTRLACMYKTGTGVPKDEGEAVKLLYQAVEHNDANAMYHLADMLSKGTGCSLDDQMAVRLLRQAAELGFKDALMSLSQRHSDGHGVVQSEEEALRLNLLACSKGFVRR